ncbi:PREDICTED: pro-FMRFamide-related neuropeptide VF [Galeopterus variegatus]|uniref:Pro-FMRFamide-related neuropeptide VF n=1 Tax=Galeopterus variegatus TaxID=482537 RepID=A0ABM0RWT1_GALVR|nr:PREDICTED: pro-FMRFamide-related neuropeptide VF [Galeopterus variegatus]
MEIIFSKRFILLILITSSLLTSKIFCADELMMFSLHSKENYNRYSEPNLPQRFGRMTTAKSVPKTLSDLHQPPTHSPPASELLYFVTCQCQEIQNPDQKQPRRLAFKKINGAELKQEK